ncbi:MAG: cardiolipin synthase [Moraxella sp.]|nr:cardiolipin synthase [Moraxella sp.]
MKLWDGWLFELFALLHIVVVLVLVANILIRQKNYSVAIAWIAVIALMPYVGVILYLIFGQIFISKRYQNRISTVRNLLMDFANTQNISLSSDDDIKTTDKWLNLAKMGESQTGFGVQRNHSATLLTSDTQIFDAILRDIHHAKKSILLEFYIVHPKGRVLEVFDALKQATARGVSCVLLADSVGSMGFFVDKSHQDLKLAGVHIQELFPVGLFKSVVARADVRNHRKLVCIDGHIGYTGSFNLADPKFFKQGSGVGAWIDVMLRVIHEEDLGVVKAMGAVITSDLSAEKDDNIYFLKNIINNYRNKIIIGKNEFTYHNNSQTHKHYATVNDVQLQLLPSAPQLSGHLVYETIISALYYAKHQIIITTPYFVPDEPLMLALLSAKRRGVDIAIIMPKVNDSKLVKYASQAYFEPLLKEGIRLALYQGGLLHSKIISVDSQYALFGTFNMDMRSFYLNMEVTLAVYRGDEHFGLLDEIDELQGDYLQACELLSFDEWRARAWYFKLLDGAVRLLSPLL